MNSSISNSNERKYLLWVLATLVGSIVVCNLDIWTGIMVNHRRHVMAARLFGEQAEFLILGDSSAGTFSYKSLSPVFDTRGLVFDADSVTPVYHLYNYRKAREAAPEFRPKVVFICTGANNFNRNGLHGRRDLGLFSLLPVSEAARLTLPNREYMTFAEVLLSRAFPVYEHRVQITHLYFNWRPDPTAGISRETVRWQDATELERTLPHVARNPIADHSYLDIYRRSVYADYEYSEVIESGLELLIREIREDAAVPVIVLLPLSDEIMQLGDEMVGPVFENNLRAFAGEQGVRLLDMRRLTYDLEDINHLSRRGAIAFFRDQLQPIVDAAVDDPDG